MLIVLCVIGNTSLHKAQFWSLRTALLDRSTEKNCHSWVSYNCKTIPRDQFLCISVHVQWICQQMGEIPVMFLFIGIYALLETHLQFRPLYWYSFMCDVVTRDWFLNNSSQIFHSSNQRHSMQFPCHGCRIPARMWSAYKAGPIYVIQYLLDVCWFHHGVFVWGDWKCRTEKWWTKKLKAEENSGLEFDGL